MALHLVWDTPDDAAEFAVAFGLYATNLFDVKAEDQPDGSVCWEDSETLCLSQTEAGSYVVRAPDLQTAATVLTTIQTDELNGG